MPSLISAPFTARGPVTAFNPPIRIGSFEAWAPAGGAARLAMARKPASSARSGPVLVPCMVVLLVCPQGRPILCPRSIDVDGSPRMSFWTLQLLNGLSFGMLLFLLAAGLSLIHGLMRILNLAHGS